MPALRLPQGPPERAPPQEGPPGRAPQQQEEAPPERAQAPPQEVPPGRVLLAQPERVATRSSPRASHSVAVLRPPSLARYLRTPGDSGCKRKAGLYFERRKLSVTT